MINNTPFQIKRQELSIADFKKEIGTEGVLMGIDYGSVRIGIALSDKKREMATPFKIISKIKELDDIVPAKDVVIVSATITITSRVKWRKVFFIFAVSNNNLAVIGQSRAVSSNPCCKHAVKHINSTHNPLHQTVRTTHAH